MSVRKIKDFEDGCVIEVQGYKWNTKMWTELILLYAKEYQFMDSGDDGQCFQWVVDLRQFLEELREEKGEKAEEKGFSLGTEDQPLIHLWLISTTGTNDENKWEELAFDKNIVPLVWDWEQDCYRYRG